MFEYLHRVRRRSVVLYPPDVQVPQFGEFCDVLVVRPVPKPRQVSVGATFSCVLSRGLPVHLQQPASGRPSMPRMMWMLFTCTAAAVAWCDW